MSARYEPVREPFGLWAIVDVEAGRPADIPGRPLVGLTEREALALARQMNAAANDHAAPVKRQPSRSA